MNINEQLLAFVSQPEYVPQTIDELAHSLQLSSEAKPELQTAIENYLETGALARIKKDRYVLPKDADLITGIIKFKQNGTAIILPNPKLPAHLSFKDPFWVSAEDTSVALNNDHVLARLIRNPSPRFRNPANADQQWVRVIRVIKRPNSTLTGTLKKAQHVYYVVPDDPCIGKDILVPPPEKSASLPQPSLEDKVVVRLKEWKLRHLNPEAEIISVLGKTHTPSAEFKAILHKYHLDTEFPLEVIQEIETFSPTLTSKDYKNRQDCRNLYTLTIDPDDAKDFDDALSLEFLDNGHRRIGVHIADVSAYVAVESPLDQEARRRGNSTYLVGCVIPMLPHLLSSGLCSLKEREDRLTKTVFLTFDAHNKVVKTEFANTIIHSNKRLTYKQAYAFLKEDSLEAVCQLLPPPEHQTAYTGIALNALPKNDLVQIQTALRELWKIAAQIRSRRFATGSLEIDVPEVKIYTGADGGADRIERIENDESHQLIEEFMLLANEVVAKTLHDAQLPFISRVHDKPENDKLNELREVLLLHNIKVGDLSKRTEVTRLLVQLRGHPQEHALKIKFLRSLKQACYRAQIDGHYGLNKTFYAHFTSPIRRYSDLVVHRIIDHYLLKSRIVSAVKNPAPVYTQSALASIAKQVSMTEQASAEAERESVKIKLLEFFEKELQKAEKTVFEAIIVEVRNHGLFVELRDSMAYGLVHVSTLENDLYALNSAGTAIQGRRTRTLFAVGQKVQVVVERINRYKRQIDFRLKEFNLKLKSSQSSSQPASAKPLREKDKSFQSTKNKSAKGSFTRFFKPKTKKVHKPNKD
jgi:ribonuclease R